ncbi:MAG: hypothetical protein J5606_07905 [Bacteroidales bacterium]|nr:hypothetical protein [Bacteroidales bacterium]
MGKIKFLIVGLFLLSISGSCRYEEPSFSFTRIKDRIRGEWRVDKVEKNGEASTAFPCYEERQTSIFSFYQTGVCIIDYSQDNINIKTAEGTWNFGDKKKTLIVNVKGEQQIISRVYTIVKFSNKELKLTYTDSNGDKWTLYLGLILSFIDYGW